MYVCVFWSVTTAVTYVRLFRPTIGWQLLLCDMLTSSHVNYHLHVIWYLEVTNVRICATRKRHRVQTAEWGTNVDCIVQTRPKKKKKQTGKVPIKAIQCKSLIKLFKDYHMTPSHSFRQREDLLVTGVTNYKSPPSIFRLLPIIPSFKQPILSIEKWRRFWQ